MFEAPASVMDQSTCEAHGEHLGLHCPACLAGDQLSVFVQPEPVSPDGGLGDRGGTTATFDEAEDRLEEYSAEQLATVKGRVIQMAARYGDGVHADYVRDGITNGQVIGTAFGQLVREGLIVEVARRRSKVKSTHGRKSGVYQLTADGKQMARALGYAEAA